MKKILCLIDNLGSGGAERQMVGLAVLLKKRGYTVDLVAYHVNDFYVQTARDGGVDPIVLLVKDNPLSKLMAVRRHIKKSGGYDWLISYKTGPGIIGCILRVFGMKLNLIVSERNTSQSIGRMEKIRFFLFRKADYVVPNSQSQVDFIQKNFPKLKNKTLAITNFTDTDFFKPCETKSNKCINVLTTARIAKQKNVLRFLEAIAVLKEKGVNNVLFDWYGDEKQGEESYVQKVYRKVEELKLADIIQFHPATKKIVEQYQHCDVFCLPSNYEGFPNVICEAMSCGKPIVCSRVCDNPYIVKEGVNALLFDNSDVNDMADKIQQICSMSTETLNRWGHVSREIAENLFSMDAFVDKYIKLIES